MTSTNLAARPAAPRGLPFRRKSKADDRTIASSASIEEIHESSVARSTIRLVCLGLVLFLVWASLAQVPEMTTGLGEVLPNQQIQNIQHLEGGQVAEIFVREGERVERGQPILQLDDLSVRAELAKATAQAEGLRLEIARRLTQNGSPDAPVLEGPLRLRGIAGSQDAAAIADRELERAQLQVAYADLDVKKADLVSLAQRQANAESELGIVERQLADFDRAVETIGLARSQRDAIERDKIQIENTLLTIETQRASGLAAVAQAEARITELQATFVQADETEVAQLEIEATSAQELVRQLEDRLGRMLVLAPETGNILSLAVNNRGQVVKPGEQIASIIPAGQPTFVEVRVNADQIGFVHVGLPANVKILTFDYTRFGSIPATISAISASSIKEDPNTPPFYLVRLELDAQAAAHLGADRQIQSGMSVAADIRLGEKSVMSFLLKPLRGITDRALTQQ